MADWSLDVVLSWRQVLPPGKTTPIVVKFTPVVAQYRMAKGDLENLDDMKVEACLKPQALAALQWRLKGSGAWQVTEISVDASGPAHWIDNPNATLSVQKPKPNAIVRSAAWTKSPLAGQPSSASRPTTATKFALSSSNLRQNERRTLAHWAPVARHQRGFRRGFTTCWEEC